MSRTPLLSVLMPAHNAERFIREAIESVLENGFDDFELLVIDDGSEDGTAAIVESINHPALHLIRQPQNLGVGVTRRNAVPLMRGKYMALLDADDIAVNGRFELQVTRLEAPDSPDILGGAIELFGDAHGRLALLPTDAAIKAGLLFDSPLANPSVCMKLAPLREGRIGYTPNPGAEDYALWVDAMRAGLCFENVPTILTRYRRHSESLTKKSFEAVSAAARVVRTRVAETYFPAMPRTERDALVYALSVQINGGPRWLDGVQAIAHAAMLARTVPQVDAGVMLRFLEDHLIRMIRHGMTIGVVDNDTLEMMTETNQHFERWRAADDGALDMRIMALLFG